MRIEKTRQTESPEHDDMLRAWLLWVIALFFWQPFIKNFCSQCYEERDILSADFVYGLEGIFFAVGVRQFISAVQHIQPGFLVIYHLVLES